MKSLLNITVFASAVLSIFSTSLALYEAPELKEAISVVEVDNMSHKSEPAKEVKRIYISHDVSGATKTQESPIVAGKKSWSESKSDQAPINAFGVLVSGNNDYKNI